MTASAFYRRLSARATRMVVVGLLCCALAVVFGGVPLPTVARKDLSTPFPCQDRACGCVNAEACWRGCCCFSNADKVAWASARGVALPEYVVAAARREAPAVASACCRAAGACAAETPKGMAATTETATASITAEEAAGVVLVSISEYRHCQGLAELWLLWGEAWSPEAGAWVCPRPVAGAWLPLLSEQGSGSAYPPDSPPPNAARV